MTCDRRRSTPRDREASRRRHRDCQELSRAVRMRPPRRWKFRPGPRRMAGRAGGIPVAGNGNHTRSSGKANPPRPPGPRQSGPLRSSGAPTRTPSHWRSMPTKQPPQALRALAVAARTRRLKRSYGCGGNRSPGAMRPCRDRAADRRARSPEFRRCSCRETRQPAAGPSAAPTHRRPPGMHPAAVRRARACCYDS